MGRQEQVRSPSIPAAIPPAFLLKNPLRFTAKCNLGAALQPWDAFLLLLSYKSHAYTASPGPGATPRAQMLSLYHLALLYKARRHRGEGALFVVDGAVSLCCGGKACREDCLLLQHKNKLCHDARAQLSLRGKARLGECRREAGEGDPAGPFWEVGWEERLVYEPSQGCS